MSVQLSSVQRFCVHDGPGIRTTVFLKGCGLHCPWCSNPESIYGGIEYFCRDDYCTKKNNHCEVNQQCAVLSNKSLREEDADKCTVGAITCYGKMVEREELHSYLLRDRSYYADSGGVTFSGGEVFLQAPALQELMEALKRDGISICVETSLFAPETFVKTLLPYIDIFIIDIKILDRQVCKDVLGGNLDIYFSNLDLVFGNKRNRKIIGRVPLVKGYSDTSENLNRIVSLLRRYPFDLCEIFSVHNLGAAKYKTLHREYSDFETLSEDEMISVMGCLETSNIPISIIRL